MATRYLLPPVQPLTPAQQARLNLKMTEIAVTVKRIVHHLTYGGKW